MLQANGHLYTFDGSTWVDNGAAGGSGVSARFNMLAPLGTFAQYRQLQAIAGCTEFSNIFTQLIPDIYHSAEDLAHYLVNVTPFTGSAEFVVSGIGPIPPLLTVAYTVI